MYGKGQQLLPTDLTLTLLAGWQLSKTLRKKGVAKGADKNTELQFFADSLKKIAKKTKGANKKTFWELNPEYKK